MLWIDLQFTKSFLESIFCYFLKLLFITSVDGLSNFQSALGVHVLCSLKDIAHSHLKFHDVLNKDAIIAAHSHAQKVT